MIDIQARDLLVEELDGVSLPFIGPPDELRALAFKLFGPPSRQPRQGSPAVVMAGAVAAAAYRYWGTHSGGPRRALDVVLRAALESQPCERAHRDEWGSMISG